MASAATPTAADADEPVEEAAPVAARGASAFAFIAAMSILTALGIALGGLMGLQLQAALDNTAQGKVESGIGPKSKNRYSANVNLKPLAPIITNLSSPERTWIRLEASLVMDGDQTADSKVLAAQISEDIVAYLRTVSLVQIQGASGFQHLREDLNDRVRVRSGGKVRDLVIQALIME